MEASSSSQVASAPLAVVKRTAKSPQSRCEAWARFVNSQDEDNRVGPEDYSRPSASEESKILEDLVEFTIVDKALNRLAKITKRHSKRARRLLLHLHWEGKPIGDFRLFEVGRGFPFELMELGLTERACLVALLGKFYDLVEECASEMESNRIEIVAELSA